MRATHEPITDHADVQIFHILPRSAICCYLMWEMMHLPLLPAIFLKNPLRRRLNQEGATRDVCRQPYPHRSGTGGQRVVVIDLGDCWQAVFTWSPISSEIQNSFFPIAATSPLPSIP
jgi:hypothetical protein